MVRKTNKGMTLAEKALFHAQAIFAHQFEIIEQIDHKDRHVFKLLPLDRAHMRKLNYVYVTLIRAFLSKAGGSEAAKVAGTHAKKLTHVVVRYKDKNYVINVSPYSLTTPNGTIKKFDYYEARRVFEEWHWYDPDADIPFFYPKPEGSWWIQKSA